MTHEHEVNTMRKVFWRLVPFLFLLLVINWLDRVNIGFAALRMNRELGLSSTAFGIGAGVFVVGYALFELPSNAVLYRLGARIWIGVIMIAWGLASGAMMFVRHETGFYVLRFLVGAAEAGFMPGLIVYLSAWFPRRYRSRGNAGVLLATALGPAIGSPVSGVLMKLLDGVHGIAGWRWMFFYEAMPAIAMGVVVFFWLTDRPADAAWLKAPERNWLTQELEAERKLLAGTASLSLLQVLKLKKIWALSALFSCLLTALYGVLLWAPQIIKSFGNLTDLDVGLLGFLPLASAGLVMPLIARHSDRCNERRMHVAVAMAIGGTALLLSAYAPNPVLAFGLLCIASIGIWGSLGVFWTMTSTFLAGPAAAFGIAVINSLAQVGGFVGPSSVGILRDRTGDFSLALAVLAAFALVGAIIASRLDDAAVTPVPAMPGGVASGDVA